MTGKQVQALREAAQMTQQEMADYLGLRDRSQVCHLEKGRNKAVGAKLRLLEMLSEKLATKSKKSSKSC